MTFTEVKKVAHRERLPPCAELEVGLHHWDQDSYAVELRFSQPDSDADVRLIQEGPALAQFDLRQFEQLLYDHEAYGRRLTQVLFAEPSVRKAFAEARSVAQSQSRPLRVRLFLSGSETDLHQLRWETLRDPEDGSALLASETVLFSRYMPSLDWRPVRALPQEELRALVVIADPADLGNWRPGGRPLAPLDVPGELERAREALETIELTELVSRGSATLENVIAQLREGYDLLYLVCHGALVRDEPRLWLEHEDGSVDVVAGSELVRRLKGLMVQPRLVVLASCESAGTGGTGDARDPGPLVALGPRLAEAGIPAVLAMQGSITMQTAAEFMPVFFRELQRDGQIDRAVAAARAAVSDRPDHWMPVLYTRLRSGRLWYETGFAEERPGFSRWPALLNNIAEGRCTPILGSSVLHCLIGSMQEIGRRWAGAYRFPMAPYLWDDLPQVAQYLSIVQDTGFPRSELTRYVRREVLRRHGADLPEELRTVALDELLAAAGAHCRKMDPANPHRVLAQLPCPVYVTTSPDNLLRDALLEAGKEPHVDLFPWSRDVEWPPGALDDPGYTPSKERPLVYHLFGSLERSDSLVLTEDDYFDYLKDFAYTKELIPPLVRSRLVNSALLFLGFQLDEWTFRVLFRSIAGLEGRSRRQKYAHVGVQLDPQRGRILEPELARRYLQSYFEDADINLYWGSVEEFVKELQHRLL